MSGGEAQPGLGLGLGVAYLPHGVTGDPGLAGKPRGKGYRHGEGETPGHGGEEPYGQTQLGVLLVEEDGNPLEFPHHGPGKPGIPSRGEDGPGPCPNKKAPGGPKA